MPKKHNSYNAFYFFMKDWQKNEEKKGFVFPNGIRDVQSNPNCNEAWKDLSDKDKAKYKKIEKEHKIKIKNDKKTSIGESLDAVIQKQREENMFIENMKEYILSMVQDAKKNNYIEKLKFCVVHVNYSYSRLIEDDVEYYPAEISIAEFSLEKGIIRTYHKIICSKVHTGYARDAKDHSNATHQISRDMGEQDQATVYKEICNFLEPNRINGKLPTLYTRYCIPDIKNPVTGVLNTFHSAYGNDIDRFVVYSFEELFVNLHNIGKPDGSDIIELNPSIVNIKLKEDPFDYKRTLQCEIT